VGSDVSTSVYRALLVPDHRLTADKFSKTLSDATQTLTQAGPKPGVPVPQQATYATVTAHGTQSANKALRIRGLEAGNAGPKGGTFGWRYNGDTLWRGWDPPATLSGFEIVDYSTVANKWRQPHAIGLPNGIVLAVAEYDSDVVKMAKRTAAGVWSTATVVDPIADVEKICPCLVRLPSGRVLCFYMLSTTSEANVQMSYSDDDGATWVQGATNCLDTPIDVSGTVTIERMRAAHLGGQILLVVEVADTSLTKDNVIIQYASRDLGAHFATLDTWTGASITRQAAYVELVATETEILFFYLADDGGGSDAQVYMRRVSSAYALLSSAAVVNAYQSGNSMRWGSLAAGAFTDGDLAAWRDEDGILYLAGRDVKDNQSSFVQMSRDNGATWEKIGQSGNATGYGASWWYGNDAAIYPSKITGCMARGQAVILHVCESDTATTLDDSLFASYLGGWTTVCLPAIKDYHDPKWRGSWERTWLPICLPTDLGGHWTGGGGGAPTVALGATGLSITGGLGDTQTYISAAVTSTLDQGMMALMQVEVDGGQAFLTINVADAVPVSYQVRVAVSTTQIVLRDLNAGADIATINTTTGTTGVQILLAVGGAAKCRAWYRAATTGGEADRQWTAIGDSSTLTAGAVANNTVQWGNLSAVGTDCKFRLVQYSFGDNTGTTSGSRAGVLYTAQTNPDELLGKAWSSTPVWVDDGVRVALPAGPAMAGDTWNIDTAYDYDARNIVPQRTPSPRRTWRSTVETQQDIVFEYDATLGQEIPIIEPVLGIALLNINFRLFELAGYDTDTSAYVTLVSGDAATGATGLSFSRLGDTIVPASGTVADEYYTFNVLEDSHVRLIGAGDGATDVVRRIARNSEGAWRVSSATKATSIVLEGVLSTDSLGGGAATCQIWSKDVVCIIPAPTKYTRYRLRITAQDTAEGYFEIGAMVLGPVVYLARQYSWGRTLSTEVTSEVSETRYGARRVRQLGPPRRSVVIPGWVEGVDVTSATTAQASPDYVTAYSASTTAVGTPRDTPYVVLGLAEYLRGMTLPLVYLPRLIRGANSGSFTINNRNNILYGRMVNAPRVESILGDEWEDEVLSVEPLTIEEEI
jgi:hypothetical protein